ncbi:MAG: MBL fold metallo-hydrolase [bacterium]
MAGNDLLVRFWGVRGSHPVPGPSTLKYGGHTSCLEIRTKDHIIILDAGTGIINLGNQLVKEFNASSAKKVLNLTILISHTHSDHVQGIPFFAPAYLGHCVLNIYGPKVSSQSLAEILTHAMEPQYSPIELDELKARMNIQNLHENDAVIFNAKSEAPDLVKQNELIHNPKQDVVVRVMRSYAHPKMGVFFFKIAVNGKSVVYATDTEGYVGNDTRLIDFAKGTDLLIHDAQYDPDEYLDANFPKQGFGHSTYEMAAQVAREAGAQQLVLFHHDPSHDDEKLAAMAAKAQELFPNTAAAAEGMEFSF